MESGAVAKMKGPEGAGRVEWWEVPCRLPQEKSCVSGEQTGEKTHSGTGIWDSSYPWRNDSMFWLLCTSCVQMVCVRP